MKRSTRTLMLAAVACTVTACAVRLGGPVPKEYDVAALQVAPNADAAAVAQQIAEAGAELVLLSTTRDSTWLEAVATAAGLPLSGPGTSSGRSLAFLTSLELLGDTSLVLPVPGGGSVHMHDALYQIEENRLIDLMMVRVDAPDLRAAVNTLLGYFATDVGSGVPLVLAIDGPTAAAADSAAVLMRAYLASAGDCDDDAASPAGDMRLLYGPSARIRCLSAGLLESAPGTITARLEVQR